MSLTLVSSTGTTKPAKAKVLAQGSAKQFIELLAPVIGIVDKSAPTHAQRSALVTRRGWDVCVQTSDVDMEYTNYARLGADDGDLAALIEARPLFELLRGLGKNEHVTLVQQDGAISLLSGTSSYSFTSADPDEFPHVGAELRAQGGKVAIIELGAADLHLGLSSIAHAAADRDIRQYLNGALMRFGPETATLVACDGYRLARYEIPRARTDDAPKVQILVPKRAVNEIIRSTKSYGGPVLIDVGVDKSAIASFRFGGMVLTTRLIDGTFPEFEKVLDVPTDNYRTAQFPRKDTVAVLKRLLTCIPKRGWPSVELALAPASCTLSATSNGKSYREKMSIAYDGKPLTLGFRMDQLIDSLTSVDDAYAELVIAQEVDGKGHVLSTAFFKFRKYPAYSVAIMPCRV